MKFWISRKIVVFPRLSESDLSVVIIIHLYSLALQPSASYGILVSRGYVITHNDAPQSVGLLWTSDQLVAETSTWKHTTLTTERHPCPWWDSNPRSQQASDCRHTPSTARPLGPAICCNVCLKMLRKSPHLLLTVLHWIIHSLKLEPLSHFRVTLSLCLLWHICIYIYTHTHSVFQLWYSLNYKTFFFLSL
jgi:hypothetical protein